MLVQFTVSEKPHEEEETYVQHHKILSVYKSPHYRLSVETRDFRLFFS